MSRRQPLFPPTAVYVAAVAVLFVLVLLREAVRWLVG